MYAKGQKKGTVRFAVKPADAKEVALAGSFNGWKPEPMKKQKDGKFSVVVDLPSGTYEYKFVVDGRWIVDPDTNTWAMNPYGSFNSIAQID